MRSDATDIRKRKIADLVLLAILATLTIVYCFDAINASTHIYNLILVVPVAAIVVALCAIQFFISLRSDNTEMAENEPITDVLPSMGLFAFYVLSLNWLGFDVGTFLFVGAFLWLQGERRWFWLVAYSLTFAMALALFFSKMLPYPMPLLLLGGM